MTDPIKAALVAAEQARIGTLIGEPPEAWANITVDPERFASMAAGVAAFLRAMASAPNARLMMVLHLPAVLHDIAAAVTLAAQEARDDR